MTLTDAEKQAKLDKYSELRSEIKATYPHTTTHGISIRVGVGWAALDRFMKGRSTTAPSIAVGFALHHGGRFTEICMSILAPKATEKYAKNSINKPVPLRHRVELAA